MHILTDTHRKKKTMKGAGRKISRTMCGYKNMIKKEN